MNLTDFKQAFNGGTRGNRFVVKGAFNNSSGTSIVHNFHVRSTFLPGVSQMVLETNAYGRKLNIPGDREYGPWNITVYDDTAGTGDNTGVKTLWKLFSEWHNSINTHVNNNTAITYPHLDYKTNWEINHLDLNGGSPPLKEFKLIGCWPKVVGDIDFNMTRRNFINTFSVVMIYDEIRIKDVHATTYT